MLPQLLSRLLLAATLMANMPSVSAAAVMQADHSAAVVAQTCTACHGTQGGGNGAYPRIVGQPTSYFESQLRFFRNGTRKNAIMQQMASALSDTDISALATYFNHLTPAYSPSSATLSSVQYSRGQQLVTRGDWQHGIPACTRCHGSDLRGVPPFIPALAGQTQTYLHTALLEFRGNNRDLRDFPTTLMRHASQGLSNDDMKAVSIYIARLVPGESPSSEETAHDSNYRFLAQSPDNFVPPPEAAIPAGPDGEMIRKGLQIFNDTQRNASSYAGNVLNCSNCHLDHGRRANSAPMWAAFVSYPKYRAKDKKVDTFEERIQGCFLYSMNGKAPAANSPVVVALVAYSHWLATGLPVGIAPKGAGYPALQAPAVTENIRRGADVYASHCAMCHGDNGEGRRTHDEQVFPPLWGPKSFNWGAGMGRISTAAAFIKTNMPFGAGGTLSDQQAWDVAAYMDSRSRPQDPRFTGDVETTRKFYHGHDSFYGRKVDGKLLGAPEKTGPVPSAPGRSLPGNSPALHPEHVLP